MAKPTKISNTVDGDQDQSLGNGQRTSVVYRLSADQATDLVAQYNAGSSVRELAAAFQIHRTTVLAHLERAGVSRRANVRKLTDDDVQDAAAQYTSGLSLKTVAEAFGVNETTVTNEFRKAGVPSRPRRGWPPSASRGNGPDRPL